jgi:hypothetical protein
VLSWLARRLLIAGGFAASWFLTRDSPLFGLIEMVVATLLLVFIVAVLAYGQRLLRAALRRASANGENAGAPHEVRRKGIGQITPLIGEQLGCFLVPGTFG